MTWSKQLTLLFRGFNWNFVCILNFSSAFILSHVFYFPSVHNPPAFTNQYQSCSSSQCDFVYPLANPSLFRPNISLSSCSSTIFLCLFVGTQTQTHTIGHISFCVTDNIYSQHRLAVWILCHLCEQLYTICSVLHN
jgi:hypothetical protein